MTKIGVLTINILRNAGLKHEEMVDLFEWDHHIFVMKKLMVKPPIKHIRSYWDYNGILYNNRIPIYTI